ncbi:antibiotic biosynthesis monooxygenase [Nocardia sputorum]|uniref:Antibiotic biosynthesis monooxygenase n=1 Tax=Nocardia sputorum TaxID=2984338 RepID=A0ABN6U7K3_9NOCA|nr:antibiotic biosynthesis monooxygenase [Nocardia sputorum]BDU01264.1 antibiotic biosynthesis monooxygenase [Nocardia sputorum]
MIIEHALLPVRPERAADFEAAFAAARPIIASMPGFRSLSLSRGVESPGSYLLRVEWDHIDDHVVGFRGSPEYQRWKDLLHHFYEPFPAVEHFAPVPLTASDNPVPVPPQGASPGLTASPPQPQ